MKIVMLEDFPIKLLRAGSEINIRVGDGDPDMTRLMFADVEPAEDDEDLTLIEAPKDITWPHLLAALGCFPSATQAKKNWCKSQGKALEIARGYEEVSVGKARRITIYLWKPYQPGGLPSV